MSFIRNTPQSTLDVYGRLGMIYYFDSPSNMDDLNSQSRAGMNYTHRFSERLRYVSRNFISYELEPDYSYGYASSRASGEYFHWNTDNAIGYRWTERLATYTGFSVSGTNFTDSKAPNNDRLTLGFNNQFRYQLTPQAVLTADYRYNTTTGNGLASDSRNHYLLGGAEYRFSPNTVGIIRTGAQFREVDDGDSNVSPYVEFVLSSQITQAWRIRSFARYGIEDYDTVHLLPAGTVEYADRRTLRFGLSSEYVISPLLSFNGGVDYVPSDFSSGRYVSGPRTGQNAPDANEDLINFYLGASIRINDFMTAMATYNHSTSTSDLDADYDRNRFSIGVSAEF